MGWALVMLGSLWECRRDRQGESLPWEGALKRAEEEEGSGRDGEISGPRKATVTISVMKTVPLPEGLHGPGSVAYIPLFPRPLCITDLSMSFPTLPRRGSWTPGSGGETGSGAPSLLRTRAGPAVILGP